MGKRSDFERAPRDKYRTPMAAVLPLLPHLTGVKRFVEPCAGDGRLMDHLESHGLECVYAGDIEPEREDIIAFDAMDVDFRLYCADAVITNPPWDRSILHPMIEHFSNQLPSWLLFDADWAHTRQAAQFIDRCSHIVSIGRVKWIENSTMSGKDNAAWFRFHAQHTGGPQFIGREAKAAA